MDSIIIQTLKVFGFVGIKTMNKTMEMEKKVLERELGELVELTLNLEIELENVVNRSN